MKNIVSKLILTPLNTKLALATSGTLSCFFVVHPQLTMSDVEWLQTSE